MEFLLGYLPDEDDAMALARENVLELSKAADEIRRHFCKDKFDLYASNGFLSVGQLK